VGADNLKGGMSVRRRAVNEMENTCALSIRPSQHIREASQIMLLAMFALFNAANQGLYIV
jgi:hypothetical protein